MRCNPLDKRTGFGLVPAPPSAARPHPPALPYVRVQRILGCCQFCHVDLDSAIYLDDVEKAHTASLEPEPQ